MRPSDNRLYDESLLAGVNDAAVAPFVLRPVQADIGFMQPAEIIVALLQQCASNGYRHRPTATTQLGFYRRADIIGCGFQSGLIDVGQQQDELFPTQPEQTVRAAAVGERYTGELDEHAIALGMPELVVDLLEVIQIHDQ